MADKSVGFGNQARDNLLAREIHKERIERTIADKKLADLFTKISAERVKTIKPIYDEEGTKIIKLEITQVKIDPETKKEVETTFTVDLSGVDPKIKEIVDKLNSEVVGEGTIRLLGHVGESGSETEPYHFPYNIKNLRYDDTDNKIKCIIETITLDNKKTKKEFPLEVEIPGGGGGEPLKYLKDAKVDGNKLTLTKKEGSILTEVDFIVDLSSKQDKITDLETIRKGAESGLTAVQPSDLSAYRKAVDQDIIDIKKVDKELVSTTGKSIILNEEDGGGAKFEGNNGINSYIGVHDGSGNNIKAQIYAIKTDKSKGVIVDVTEDKAYYYKGEVKEAAVRDTETNEIAVKGDIKNVTESGGIIDERIKTTETKLVEKIEDIKAINTVSVTGGDIVEKIKFGNGEEYQVLTKTSQLDNDSQYADTAITDVEKNEILALLD